MLSVRGIIPNMEKNNQPLILGAIAIGAVLIIALALIFTRGSDETTTETTVTDDTSENREDTNTGENDENDQPQPTPQPTPAPNPAPTPNPQSGVLPNNWDNLTSQEKTELNPLNCDHDTQWVASENGTCIDKGNDDSDSEVIESGTFAGIDYIIWGVEREPYCGPTPDDSAHYGCLDDKWEAIVRIALKGSPTESQIAEFWSVFKDDYFNRTEVVSMLGVIYEYPDFDVVNPNNTEYVIDTFFDHVEGYSGLEVYTGCSSGWIELSDRTCIVEN